MIVTFIVCHVLRAAPLRFRVDDFPVVFIAVESVQDVGTQRQQAVVEQGVSNVRRDDDGHKRNEHRQSLEGEQLIAGRGVIPRVLDQRGKTQQWLSARQPEEHPGSEPTEGAVGVGRGDVNDTEELREKNDVDEVGAQVP